MVTQEEEEKLKKGEGKKINKIKQEEKEGEEGGERCSDSDASDASTSSFSTVPSSLGIKKDTNNNYYYLYNNKNINSNNNNKNNTPVHDATIVDIKSIENSEGKKNEKEIKAKNENVSQKKPRKKSAHFKEEIIEIDSLLLPSKSKSLNFIGGRKGKGLSSSSFSPSGIRLPIVTEVRSEEKEEEESSSDEESLYNNPIYYTIKSKEKTGIKDDKKTENYKVKSKSSSEKISQNYGKSKAPTFNFNATIPLSSSTSDTNYPSFLLLPPSQQLQYQQQEEQTGTRQPLSSEIDVNPSTFSRKTDLSSMTGAHFSFME